MTISELLGHSTDELEKMSDQELREYLTPHLIYSRPTSTRQLQPPKIKPPKIKLPKAPALSPQEQASQLLANVFGYKV